MKELWTEKYRPKTIDGYVFTDTSTKNKSRIGLKKAVALTCCYTDLQAQVRLRWLRSL